MKSPTIHDLTGKVVVITGAAGILGESFARTLAKAHAKVALLDLNEQQAKAIANTLIEEGYEAIGIGCNVLNVESLETAKEEVLRTFHRVDVLINGAGGNHPLGTTEDVYYEPSAKDIKTFFDLDPQSIRFVFDLNFLGTLLPTQVFAKEMKAYSSIVNISSMNAYTPLTKIPAYSGAKAAVSNFTQWLSTYFSKAKIRVNAIAPGFFLTKQNEALLKDSSGNFTDRAKQIIAHTPMGRFGENDELIGALLFLISEEASGFIRGVILPVDGGFNAYSGV